MREVDRHPDQLKLVLGDRSGTVSAVLTKDAGEPCRPGEVVFVTGTFTGVHLKVKSLRRARDGEYAHTDLHEGPARDLEQMERDLRELLATIQNPHLRGLLSAVFAESWSGYREAPAGKRYHHAYRHGLLEHSLTVAQSVSAISAMFPGIDRDVAVAGALLHDIGKAVDHEVSGTHVEIGRRILEKFGADKRIIQAMQSHHEEYPYETPEAVIVQVADAVSGGRPGARRDTVERYLERLGDLERIAQSFPGVEKTYAIQAGREIRVFVNPGKVNDLAAHKLARDIAKRIQEELKYPGEIKVNVIRENRVVEFAR